VAIRTIHYGIGAMGSLIAHHALSRADLQVVGAVDVDPGKVGHDLGEVIGLTEPAGIVVTHPDEASWPQADVVLHSTSSKLEIVAPNIEQVIAHGLDMVSICEELAFPHDGNTALAARLDQLARERGVTVLATGVNPGFAMDTWPISLTAISRRVDSMTVRRVLDASERRLPFRQKVGVGLRVEEFEAKVATGSFGHVGLRESALAIAHALGWERHQIERTLDPVVANEGIAVSPHVVPRGHVAGIHEILVLRQEGRAVLTLDLTMVAGVLDPRDEVEIVGDPPVHVVAHGGFHGDSATAGITVNAAAAVLRAAPGLLTMRDVPPVHWSVGKR
jgi:2,4-diaminopentanoate dehydrogenase